MQEAWLRDQGNGLLLARGTVKYVQIKTDVITNLSCYPKVRTFYHTANFLTFLFPQKFLRENAWCWRIGVNWPSWS